MKIKKLFSVSDYDSIKIPVTKIIVFLIIIILLMFRGHLYSTQHSIILEILDFFAAGVIGCGSIFGICIAIAELDSLSEKRSKLSSRQKKACQPVKYSTDFILNQIEKNDILDIELERRGALVRVGASSDSKPSSSRFFDKQYYIGKRTYMDFEAFQRALLQYAADGYFNVTLVDECAPGKYFKRAGAK